MHEPEASASASAHAITFRSMVIAVLLMPVNAVLLVLIEVLWANSAPTALSLFYNVVFVLFWLVIANAGVRRVRPSWALQPGELFTIYTMLTLASALASIDMLDILVPTLSHLHHFDPIERRYGDIIEHVPEWLVVTDRDAVQAYYVGQESVFDPALIGPWIKPLGIWTLFVFAVFIVMGGIVLLFRRPWTQHEKLAYPVLQAPMLLVNHTGELVRSPIFWIGFSVVATLNAMNGLHTLYPLMPHIPVVQVVNFQSFFPERPWADMGPVIASFYPFAIAMCFFMPVDLAFSCWFFYFVFKLQRVAASWYGVHGMPGFPYVEEQTAGGYYALALLALWMTRRHLIRSVRLAFGARLPDADVDERSDARIAWSLIVFGGMFLMAFSLYHGMSLWTSAAFFAGYFVVSTAVTRMRAELGYPSHDLHAIGPNVQIVKFVGAAHMGQHHPKDLVMFGFYNFLTRAYRAHPMPHGLEALRIAERVGMSHRRYMVAMAVAVVFGTVAAWFGVLWVFMKYGGSHITGIGEYFGRETWEQVDRWFTTPERHLWQPLYAMALGLLFSLGLATLRLNLAWWPFHPVGYAVSGSWSMDQLWMCFIVAWAIKVALLKYGGARAYQRATPLFVGAMLGDFTVGSLWNIYGVVAEIDTYHFWPY